MVGPERQIQLAFIANEYYRVGKSKVEIAQESGLSRFQVARMLDEAQALGIISFSIAAPGPVDVELSLALQNRFGLKRAVVVAVPSEERDIIQEALGRVAADLLKEIVQAGDVIGLTAGRTLSVMARKVRDLPLCDVVQLAGVAGPIQSTGIEVIRRVSAASGGRAHSIYAPLVVSDIESVAAFTRQTELRSTVNRFSQVTVAMVAVGSWNPPESQMYENAAIHPALRRKLIERGVTAELCGTLITSEGDIVADMDDLTIAVPTADLRRIPEVVAVAGGPNKTAAVRAAILSGLADSVVTDVPLARRLLAIGKSPQPVAASG